MQQGCGQIYRRKHGATTLNILNEPSVSQESFAALLRYR